jgi:erythronate-4-phosphate dehydrogenase
VKLLIDKNIPFAEKAFGSIGEVLAVSTRELTRERAQDADVLIVRTETKVDRSLLEGSTVKFVGTATIGTDHIDLAYLASRGIAFASAPGCNSNAVKEYVTAALLELASRSGMTLAGRTIGVVGVGSVGSKVVRVAEALCMRVAQNDPPLERLTEKHPFVTLEEALGSDIVTVHVPLTHSGPDATYHLFDRERLGRLKAQSVFINTSRGPVAATDALKEAVRKKGLRTVLDVWEHEPAFDGELLALSELSTPHIAGYSLEGKVNATRMIREAVCRHFWNRTAWDPREDLPASPVTEITVGPDALPAQEILRRVVRQCYDITSDDSALRRSLGMPEAGRPEHFRALRSGYAHRREFSNVTVRLPEKHAGLENTFLSLGFRCSIRTHGKEGKPT